MSPRTLLSTAALAAELDIHPGTLANWRVTGGGPPFIRVGGAIRYRREAVDAWMRDREAHNTAEADAIDRRHRAERRGGAR